MLTREQILALKKLRESGDNIFRNLPSDVIDKHFNYDPDPNSNILEALCLASSGLEADLNALVEMVKANPRILLQAGNVTTRGGVEVERTTIYEFLLGEGDHVGAKAIEFGFNELSKMKDNGGVLLDGGKERISQYERYRPHIEALANQMKTRKASIDLQPLIDIIIAAEPRDVKAVLDDNMNHESALRDALIAFRETIKAQSKNVGMHYDHYMTILYACNHLQRYWEKLSNGNKNVDKCDLIYRHIIGSLQQGLPAVDRIAFARKFNNEKRSLNYIANFDEKDSFPDAPRQVIGGNSNHSGLGYDYAIFGDALKSLPGPKHYVNLGGSWRKHVDQKIQGLQKLHELTNHIQVELDKLQMPPQKAVHSAGLFSHKEVAQPERQEKPLPQPPRRK